MVVEDVAEACAKRVLALGRQTLEIVEEGAICACDLADVAKEALCFVERNDGGVAILCEGAEGDGVLLVEDVDAVDVTPFCVDELLDAGKEASRVDLGGLGAGWCCGSAGGAGEEEETALILEPLADLGTELCSSGKLDPAMDRHRGRRPTRLAKR